jgi:uncharacterized membrane protein
VFYCKKFGHISANCRNNKINHFKKNKQPKKEHPQRSVPSVSRYKNSFMGIVSYVMILVIKVLIVGPMEQGVEIISTKDLNIFLHFLGTLDVMFVIMWAIRPRIAKLPMCFRKSNQRKKVMQSQSVKKPNKNMHAKDQPHKIWRRKEQQITPTKN